MFLGRQIPSDARPVVQVARIAGVKRAAAEEEVVEDEDDGNVDMSTGAAPKKKVGPKGRHRGQARRPQRGRVRRQRHQLAWPERRARRRQRRRGRGRRQRRRGGAVDTSRSNTTILDMAAPLLDFYICCCLLLMLLDC